MPTPSPGSGATTPPPMPTPPPGFGATPPPPPGFYPVGGTTGGQQYAGFGSRLLARFVDGLLAGVISAPFTIGAFVLWAKAIENCDRFEGANGTEITCATGQVKVGMVVGGIGVAVLGALIVALFFSRLLGKGQTPGMKVAGNRLVDADAGTPVGMGRAFGRLLFASVISGSICFLGYLWMLWDPKKQTWHDKVVNAIVIKA